jgi:hypothetical protein
MLLMSTIYQICTVQGRVESQQSPIGSINKMMVILTRIKKVSLKLQTHKHKKRRHDFCVFCFNARMNINDVYLLPVKLSVKQLLHLKLVDIER